MLRTGVVGSCHQGLETTLEADMSQSSPPEEPRAPGTNAGLTHMDEKDESNDDTSVASESEEFDYGNALKSIHDSIEWLHRLSFTLRRPSVINQHLQAQSRTCSALEASGSESSLLSDDDVDSYVHTVGSRFPKLSEELKSRMSQTMAERHRRLLVRSDQVREGWEQRHGFFKSTRADAAGEKAAEATIASISYAPSIGPTNAGLPWPSDFHPHEMHLELPQLPEEYKSSDWPDPGNFPCGFCCRVLPSTIRGDLQLWK